MDKKIAGLVGAISALAPMVRWTRRRRKASLKS